MRPKLRQILNSGSLKRPVSSLTGIGESGAKKLKRIGIETVEELLFYLPRKHVDFTKWFSIFELGPGQKGPVSCEVLNVSWRRTLKGQTLISAIVNDGNINFEAVWFGQPYLKKMLRPGIKIAVYGPVQSISGKTQMRVEQFEVLFEGKESRHLKGIVPLYPLKEDVYVKSVRNAIRSAVSKFSDLPDPIPAKIRRKRSLIGRGAAIREIHFPSGWEALTSSSSRLIYEELFRIQLALAFKKKTAQECVGFAHETEGALIDQFESALPFSLTDEQRQVIGEIDADLRSKMPMNRLLQGDVGSGKTVVALRSMIVAVNNGKQAALLAPTEVLAAQHFQVIGKFIDGLPVKVSLMTSSLKGREKKENLKALAGGEIDIVVGTHALIEEGVKFANLSVVVVDEQHKFGVLQRDKLRNKGSLVDTLVMTATPIPRTLSMTLYGDLDVSIIKQSPGKKRSVKTFLLTQLEAERAYERVRAEVSAGMSAYIVCPLVTESDLVEAKAAEEEFKKLSGQVFPGIEMELLHGRMSSDEKEKSITRFREGSSPILVCTTVIEVGVDVPEATIMVIEGAERFGLAQLHQLRGRVGRGEAPSECYLVAEPKTEEAKQRLEAIVEIDDGFALAEKDLDIRGEGQLFGSKQSGLTDLKIARLSRDLDTLQQAREDAFEIVLKDPYIQHDENSMLKEFIQQKLGTEMEWLFKS